MDIVRSLGQVDSTVLAAYILSRDKPMSHLKLQKLLYFIEGYHLAYFDGKSLIEDEFQAWAHGPVSRKIFDELKDKSILYGDLIYTVKEGEEPPVNILRESITSTQFEVIEEVLSMYTNYSGLQLEDITHSQTPWLKARQGYAPGDRCENVISRDDMLSYFKGFLN